MEKYKCKQCPKVYNNGRALGGHMRTHQVDSPTNLQEEEENHQELEENHQELEEKEDSSSSFSVSNPTKRRSKRVIKRPRQTESLEPVSSVSDTSPEEDVARCLMMLSRDTWGVDSVEVVVPKQHKCEVCQKTFKSSQALGGHRTSHKKPKKENMVESTRVVAKAEGKKVVKKNVHECPICSRVFGSGQALGGHKRSHFLISPVGNNASSSANVDDDTEDNKSAKFGDNWIDLNMPAPMEDDDDMSAVSVAEFVTYG